MDPLAVLTGNDAFGTEDQTIFSVLVKSSESSCDLVLGEVL